MTKPIQDFKFLVTEILATILSNVGLGDLILVLWYKVKRCFCKFKQLNNRGKLVLCKAKDK